MALRDRIIIAGLVCMLLIMPAACSAGSLTGMPAGASTQAAIAASGAVPVQAVTAASASAETSVPAFTSSLTVPVPAATLPTQTPLPTEGTVPTEDTVPTAGPGATAPEAAAPSPVETTVARTQALAGVVEVGDGCMLERDIIPQLTRIFALSPAKVKAALAAVRPSRLIAPSLRDFRRMEGIIAPGRYEIRAGARIEDQIEAWIGLAEARYDRLLRDVRATAAVNGLTPSQHLILASMVEAECLADAHEREVATVFLNRIDRNGLLQSCVTVEYAVGYQRPYLLKTDIQVESPYNTYHVAGLPPGPISAPDDNSLRAAISRKLDSPIMYFFYDYLKNDLFCFVQYSDFSRAAAVSKEAFIARSPVGRWDKINKQKLYGR